MKATSHQQHIYKTFLITVIVLLLTGTSFAGNFNTEKGKPVYLEVVDKRAELSDGINALREKINYPRAAQLAGYEGKVVAKVYVNESGRVDGVDFIQKMGGGFETSVRNAIMKEKFIPAIHNNRPVKSVAVLSFRFQLDKD